MEVLGEKGGGGMEVDGGVWYPSGVDSGLWVPFSRPRGGEKGRDGGSSDRSGD
jgi:hypothetical protein